jgi:hypothetical protein
MLYFGNALQRTLFLFNLMARLFIFFNQILYIEFMYQVIDVASILLYKLFRLIWENTWFSYNLMLYLLYFFRMIWTIKTYLCSFIAVVYYSLKFFLAWLYFFFLSFSIILLFFIYSMHITLNILNIIIRVLIYVWQLRHRGLVLLRKWILCRLNVICVLIHLVNDILVLIWNIIVFSGLLFYETFPS